MTLGKHYRKRSTHHGVSSAHHRGSARAKKRFVKGRGKAKAQIMAFETTPELAYTVCDFLDELSEDGSPKAVRLLRRLRLDCAKYGATKRTVR